MILKAIRIVMIVIGSLLLLNAAVLAATTNMHHGHGIQGVASLALIAYGIFLPKIPKVAHFAAGGFALILISFMAFLGIYGNLGRANFDEDVVIVLGAGLNGEEVGTHLARRLDAAIDYLNRNENALVVVTGGLGEAQTITEALAMERYLVARGINPHRIIQEDASTTTYENLLFAKEILSDYFEDGFRAVLISNDFHMFRASAMARGLGFDIVPIGAPTPPLTLGVNYLREIAAIIHFWIFGG
ncbi:MAG: YdcF family protein [Defluviitaleaceae bacterium]|nr:YdcF family protein [Defluviitaleaceae bacterium]